MDGKLVRRRKNEYWDQAMTLKFSMGLRRPLKDDPMSEHATKEGFPTVFKVDYVRVWKRPEW